MSMVEQRVGMRSSVAFADELLLLLRVHTGMSISPAARQTLNSKLDDLRQANQISLILWIALRC